MSKTNACENGLLELLFKNTDFALIVGRILRGSMRDGEQCFC